MTTHTVGQEPHPQITGPGQVSETGRERKTVEVAGAGATTEALGAAAAIVLAIIGLAGAIPTAMMSIATIVLGAAILLDAGVIGARYNRLVSDVYEGEGRVVHAEVGGGISAGAIGGIAGVVLGILALLGLSPVLLCSVALIVFGAALLFGSAAKGRFASLSTDRYGVTDTTRRVIDEAIGLAAGGEVLVGLGAVVLGILAVLGIDPQPLVLVGFICVGAIVLLAGSALGARMLTMLRQAR